MNDIIEPYNIKMGEPGSVNQYIIKSQLEKNFSINDEILFIGGKLYSKILKKYPEYNIKYITEYMKLPIMTMGYQQEYLFNHKGEYVNKYFSNGENK